MLPLPGSALMAGASVAALASTAPSLVLNFAAMAELDSRITLSRSSHATMRDASGKLTWAPNNICLYSEDLTNASWIDSGITPVATTLSNGLGGLEVPSAAHQNWAVYDVSNAAWVITAKAWSTTSGRVYQKVRAPAGCTALRIYPLRYATTEYTYQQFTVVPGASYIASFYTDGLKVGGVQLERVTYETEPRAYHKTEGTAYYGPRLDHDADGNALGLLREPQGTNKCTNYNANPTDLTGVTKGGEAAATLTLVDDSAELAAAGLDGICSNGSVYKLDNSAGATAAYAVNTAGQPGNTNAHSMTAYVRGGTGVIGLNLATSWTSFTASEAYRRVYSLNKTSAETNRYFYIQADAGQTVYFILNQLEESSFPTSVIPIAGANATRAAEIPIISADLGLNAEEGTFVVEAQVIGPAGLTAIYGLQNSTGSEGISVYANATPAILSVVDAGGVSQALINAGNVVAGAYFKHALAYRSNDIQPSMNGNLAPPDQSASLPELTDVKLGLGIFRTGFPGPGAMYLRSLRYYRRRLSNAQLEALSA